ncbi:MAG: tetrahydromethanopterin S-methyltransferase subunit F [Candidatus Nezhaarchaeales archaeon]
MRTLQKMKVELAPNWPVAVGDYVVGDPKGCVAICTLGSEGICSFLVKMPGVAIVGPCKTENVGLEKIILNVISNPNIRFLIVCGIEVTGHLPGLSFKALYENGIEPATKRIKEAPGAIPYIEHLTVEAVERFQKQVQFIDMIGVEDINIIKAKVEELVTQDPGAYPEPPFIVDIEKKETRETTIPKLILVPSITPSLSTLSALMSDVKRRVQLIERERKIITAVEVTRAWSIVAGILLAFLLFGLLALVVILGGT